VIAVFAILLLLGVGLAVVGSACWGVNSGKGVLGSKAMSWMAIGIAVAGIVTIVATLGSVVMAIAIGGRAFP
jgi:hypothetical protein